MTHNITAPPTFFDSCGCFLLHQRWLLVLVFLVVVPYPSKNQ